MFQKTPPLLIASRAQVQYCSKCHWTGNVPIRSDMLPPLHSACPKCNGKLTFKEMSVLDKVKSLLR